MKKFFLLCVVCIIYSFPLLACAPSDDAASVGPDTAFLLNGKAYSMRQYNTYRAGQPQKIVSEKDIFERYVRQQVIFLDAENSGFTVTEEEIDNDVKDRTEQMEQNPEIKKQMEEYAASQGLSLKEYIQTWRATSRQTLLAQKRKEQLKKEYDEAYPSDPSGNFNTYYEEYADRLRKDAEIEIIDSTLKDKLT